MSAKGHRTQLIIAAIVGLIVIVAALDEFVKPRVFPKKFGVVIEDSLYRSGRIHESLLPKILKDYEIDTIVTLTHAIDTIEWQQAERRIAKELNVELIRFPLRGDGTGDITSYIEALRAINKELGNDRRVLVHCAAGTERTGGAVFLYRTLFLGQAQADAFAEMRDYGFNPERNIALLPYLVDGLPIIVAGLAQYGLTTASVPDMSLLEH
jgi:protein tyrosine phosphatase